MTIEEVDSFVITHCPNADNALGDFGVKDVECIEGWIDTACVECWNREIPGTDPTDACFAEDGHSPVIKDSGSRTEFPSGAVRDIQEGKGRCDLMPLDVVGEIYLHKTDRLGAPDVLINIHIFMGNGDPDRLEQVLECFLLLDHPFGDANWSTMFLEVAKHFEEGAKKYGENNWQKGIPVRCYIDSAVRHYLKWLRGDKDEPHDRAFCWNIMCAIWTCKHKPELNDYAVREEVPGQMHMCVTCGAPIPEKWQYCNTCWENLNGGG